MSSKRTALTKKLVESNNNSILGFVGEESLTEYYMDFRLFRKKQVTESWIHQLAQRLIKWAQEDDDALIITEFQFKEGINENDVSRWRNKYPLFDESYLLAKAIIGNRREKGGLKNSLNSGMVRYSMSMYNNEWDKLDKRWAELREAENKAATAKEIIELVAANTLRDFAKDKQEKD